MRLTDVARSSLAELAGDYLNWLLQQDKAPWRKDSPDAREVYGIRLDRPKYGEDVVHDASKHILAQKKKFSKWLGSGDDEIVANVLLILIARVVNMLNHQMETQGEKFKREGGFREKLTGIRVETRAKQESAPECPDCGKPMTRRKARSGKNAGKDFWGCSGYPNCCGTRICAMVWRQHASRPSHVCYDVGHYEYPDPEGAREKELNHEGDEADGHPADGDVGSTDPGNRQRQ